MNESWIDIPRGDGWLLLCENEDRPGVVGAIGTFLGAARHQHQLHEPGPQGGARAAR